MRNSLFSLCIWLMIAAGSFLAVCGAFDFWESRNAQNQIAAEWRQQTESSSQEPVAAANPHSNPKSEDQTARRPEHRTVPQTGQAVAKLTIPRLGTVLYVVEGTDDRDLKRGPGHMAGTVLPGQDGNCVIAGHRDTHFRVLKQIRDGDGIVLERRGHDYRYRVSEMKLVTPDQTESLRPTSKPVLNLITCYPFEYVGSAPKRFVVHADLESSPLQASSLQASR